VLQRVLSGSAKLLQRQQQQQQHQQMVVGQACSAFESKDCRMLIIFGAWRLYHLGFRARLKKQPIYVYFGVGVRVVMWGIC
jgi:hypothetical protein